MLLANRTLLVEVLLGAMPDASGPSYRASPRDWGLAGLLGLKCLLYHSDGFLLVAQSGKAAEGHVVRPVEAAELLGVLHAIGPVVLALDAVGDLFAPMLVARRRLIFLHHQTVVQLVQLRGLRVIARLDLPDHIVELLRAGFLDAVA